MPRLALKTIAECRYGLPADEKAVFYGGGAARTDLTDFVRQNSLRAARAVIQEAEHLELSERDSLRVLAVLENPPNELEAAGGRKIVQIGNERSRHGTEEAIGKTGMTGSAFGLRRNGAERIPAALRP